MLDSRMGTRFIRMKTRLFLLFSIATIGLVPAPPAGAWGRTGHAIIGHAAVADLETSKLARAMDILGVSTAAELPAAVEEACYWPDTVRENSQWAWSAPLHFVNIPRASKHYDRQRDCPDGRCAPEAILKYAAALSRPGLEPESRWRAFAWLCHLVGDLHQPLHAGFRDDRGGNLIEVDFHGERYNLHRFWDRTLADERLAGQGQSAFQLDPWLEPAAAAPWIPVDVAAWTEESHALAATRAYPPGPVIGDDFADLSWTIIRQQWGKAAVRLARVLDVVLTEEGVGEPD
jgi:hypothetical protein